MDINPKSQWHSSDFVQSSGGYYPKDNHDTREIGDLEPWDTTRRDMIILLLRTIVDLNIAGSLAELGVYKGSTARLIHYYVPERRLFLFDTFEGFTEKGVAAEQQNTRLSIHASLFADTSLESVKERVAQKNGNVTFCKGYFPGSIPPELSSLKFAFVHLDADLYEPTLEGLKFFYPRMSERGILLVHDYNAWVGARKAVDDFFADKKELPVPMPDKSGSVVITKLGT